MSQVNISLLFVFVQAKSLLGGGKVPLQTRVQIEHKQQTLGYVSGYGDTVCGLWFVRLRDQNVPIIKTPVYR